MTAHYQWLSKTRSVPYRTTSVFSSAVIALVLIYESVTFDSLRTNEEWRLTCDLRLNPELSYEWLSESESCNTTDGQSASLFLNKSPILGLQPDFYFCLTVAGLLMWDALSDERTGLSLQLLLALASAVILRSKLRWTRDHILLSHIRDFHFRRLLQLAGSRWRYWTLPPHGLTQRVWA
jgi:hypothetical protein